MSEEILVHHCAPTLAGIKTGSMVPQHYKSRAEMASSLRRLNQKLTPKGLRVLPLRYCESYALIYVYRPAELAADLQASAARRILERAGYAAGSANQCVIELIRRINAQEEFPHEVGLFLSYPPEDVQGFIEHKGEQCKCVGCWKVYGDAEKARETFARYQRCKQCYALQWSKGIAVERLAVAA